MVSAATLLQIWERLQACGPADRSLRLLALAMPDQDRDALANVDLASRDWHLLRLHLALFGPELAGAAECPECGERLEVEFNAGAIGAARPAESPQYTSPDGTRFRLPTVGDLVAIARIENSETAARLLFERCRLDDGEGDAANFDEIDEGLEALAADRAIHLEISCAACGQRSRHGLDPGDFVWSEIAARAGILFDEVDRLAQAYKWSESDILAMSAARRAEYLNRVP